VSNCSHCQSPLTPEGKFCSICGKAQASEIDTCFHCGTPTRSADTYCVGTEFIFGATLGGLACGVRVVNRFGKRQSVMTLVKRNVIKLLLFIGPYTMASYVTPDHEVVKW
jgi:hypothetical protein